LLRRLISLPATKTTDFLKKTAEQNPRNIQGSIDSRESSPVRRAPPGPSDNRPSIAPQPVPQATSSAPDGPGQSRVSSPAEVGSKPAKTRSTGKTVLTPVSKPAASHAKASDDGQASSFSGWAALILAVVVVVALHSNTGSTPNRISQARPAGSHTRTESPRVVPINLSFIGRVPSVDKQLPEASGQWIRDSGR
jgi:hypothetical protein